MKGKLQVLIIIYQYNIDYYYFNNYIQLHFYVARLFFL